MADDVSHEDGEAGFTTPAALDYAPPARNRRRRPVIVLVAGFVWSVVVLLSLTLVAWNGGTDVLGWHVWCLVPVGAVVVGGVAGAGYGVASRLSGARLGSRWGLTVFLLLILAYFVAEYGNFRTLHLVHRGNGSPVGFWEFFDATTRSYASRNAASGQTTPLNAGGYVVRFLDILAFAAAATSVPAYVALNPFCDLCRTFMKTRRLALFPASLPYRSRVDSDAAARAAIRAAQQEVYDTAMEGVGMLAEAAAAGEFETLLEAIDAVRPSQRETAKLPQRIEMTLVTCPTCGTGVLRMTLLTGQGAAQRRRQLADVRLRPGLVHHFGPP